MKYKMIFTFLFFSSFMGALERLPEQYCISYGKKDASLEIIEYFSFSCPQCIRCFTREFEGIKDKYIDSGLIRWVFHPMPMDLSTIQAMHCLSLLDGDKKKIFLEAILPEMDGQRPDLAVALMKRAMDFFSQEVIDLENLELLGETSTFQDAFSYVNQDNTVEAVPSLEVNGKQLSEIPTEYTVERLWNQIKETL